MKFDLSKAMLNLEQNDLRRKKRDVFRSRFPMSQTFYLAAKSIAEFIREHAVTDTKSYGLIAAGEVVEDDDHLLNLLGEQDEISIEFRCIAWEPGGIDEQVYQWLRHAEQQGQ